MVEVVKRLVAVKNFRIKKKLVFESNITTLDHHKSTISNQYDICPISTKTQAY